MQLHVTTQNANLSVFIISVSVRLLKGNGIAKIAWKGKRKRTIFS